MDVSEVGGFLYTILSRDVLTGRIQARKKLPQDVAALMWSGEQLLAGDADGRLMVLNLK
jgi:hypothetical protein